MTATTDSARNTLVREIPIERIHPSTFNPRRSFAAEALAELAESIQQHGLIEPIVVRPHPTPDLVAGSDAAFEEHWEIIAGERRWRAATQAGLEVIPAMVRDVDDATAIQLAVIENLQRQDLDPIDEAHGFQLLLERGGLTQRDAAAALNRSQPAIANALRLLRLPEKVQQRIREGELSRAHGVALMKFDGFPGVQHELAKVAVRRKMSSKDLENPLQDWQVEEALTRAGVARKLLSYSTTFDVSVCETCPFKARRKGSYAHLCLNPEHYDELEAAAVEVKQQEREAALAEATAAGAELPSLRDMSGGYQDLRYHLDPDYAHQRVPTGCSETCPCRAQALGYDGQEVIPVCLDLTRFEQLRAADKEAEAEHKKAMLKLRLAQLEEKVDELPALGTITPDELIVLAGEALARVGKKSLPVIVAERHGHTEIAEHKDWSWRTVQESPELFAKLPSLQIIKFALEVVLRNELLDRYEGYGGSSPLADYYLGPEPEADEPGKLEPEVAP